MSLTAEDIQTQQFHVRFRGFDVEEVDHFLEKVAENFVLILDEKKQLEEKIEKLEMEISDFHSQEKTFHSAIMSAQKITDEMQRKSREEADELLSNTREEIRRLKDQAEEERNVLRQEIEDLKGSKEKIKEELRTYLQAYIDRLDEDVPLRDEAPLSLLQTDMQDKKEEDDLTDLYEKIDLPDDMSEEEAIAAREKKEAGEEMAQAAQETEAMEFDESGNNEEDLTIPDLEGDMLFSLEDPLEQEKDLNVAIEPPEEEESDTKK